MPFGNLKRYKGKEGKKGEDNTIEQRGKRFF